VDLRASHILGRWARVLSLAGASWALPAGAQAQGVESRSDPAAARALFVAAIEALDRGDWDEACRGFEASMRLNPAVPALLNIAKCHERGGELTLALEDYRRALTLNEETIGSERRREAEEYARGAIAALDARIPRLTVTLAARPGGLALKRDGKELPVSAAGQPLPVDPGEHVMDAEAPGYEPERRTVVLEEGGSATVELAPRRAIPRPAPQPRGRRGAVAPRPQGGDIPVAGAALAGAGVALAAAAVGFALDANSAASEIEDRCGADRTCDPKRFDQEFLDDLNGRKARGLGLGIGLFAAGGVAIATGTWLLVTRWSERPGQPPAHGSASAGPVVCPWARPDAGGAFVTGAF
jgi:hypothetical protein